MSTSNSEWLRSIGILDCRHRWKNFHQRSISLYPREETEFIRDRIQVACPDSLLSFLVLHCEPADTHAPWAHPDYASFSDQHKELLTHA